MAVERGCSVAERPEAERVGEAGGGAEHGEGAGPEPGLRRALTCAPASDRLC